MPGVQLVQAKFKNGLANGKGKIFYEDGSFLEGQFRDGVFIGIGRLYSGVQIADSLQLVGHFVRGRLHGPAWIFMPTNSRTSNFKEEGAILVHFENGKIDDRKRVTYVPKSGAISFSGKLHNEYIITDTISYEISEIATWQCITVVNGPSQIQSEIEDPIRLPVKIVTDVEWGRIHIHNSNVLFFNPIARTGSETFLWLLHEIKNQRRESFRIEMPRPRMDPSQDGHWKNRNLKLKPKANVMESYDNVHNVVTEISNYNEPLLYAKPYNFVNFEEHGSLWAPDFFSIVRDPIEKVNFYQY